MRRLCWRSKTKGFFQDADTKCQVEFKGSSDSHSKYQLSDPQSSEKISQDGLKLPVVQENWDWHIDTRIDWCGLIEELS